VPSSAHCGKHTKDDKTAKGDRLRARRLYARGLSCGGRLTPAFTPHTVLDSLSYSTSRVCSVEQLITIVLSAATASWGRTLALNANDTHSFVNGTASPSSTACSRQSSTIRHDKITGEALPDAYKGRKDACLTAFSLSHSLLTHHHYHGPRSSVHRARQSQGGERCVQSIRSCL
jgi:hypothetical protein